VTDYRPIAAGGPRSTLRQGARVLKREWEGIKSPTEAGLSNRDSNRAELTRQHRSFWSRSRRSRNYAAARRARPSHRHHRPPISINALMTID